MNEPNYEAIGHCVVLRRRIDEYIRLIYEVKTSIIAAEFPRLLGDTLVINSYFADYISDVESTVSIMKERLLLSIEEHNKYASQAALPLITMEEPSDASANTARMP